MLENAGVQSVTAWAKSILAGPPSEASQTVSFRLSNNDTALFSVQPSISPTGTLTYTPASNQSGIASVSVRLHDNGGTSNGGVDTSALDTFTISVTAVNQAPSFVGGANQTVLENAGAQSVAAWAKSIVAGPASESSQTVSFHLSNTNTTLFGAQPSISPTGTLTYTPAANQFGTATVSVRLHDNGGTSNGGVDTSALDTFTITVTAVNQAPSFTQGSNQTVQENAGSQTVAKWATSILAGPPSEASQTVAFRVANSNAALFSAQPAISSTGTLTYTPASYQSGVAKVYVRLGDNGGEANGGVDSSGIDTFSITVQQNLFLVLKPSLLRIRPADTATFILTAQTLAGKDSSLAPGQVAWSWNPPLGTLNNGHVSNTVAGTATVYAKGLGTIDSAQLVVAPLDTVLTAGSDSVVLAVGSGIDAIAPSRTNTRHIAIGIKDTALGAGFEVSIASIKVGTVSADTTSLPIQIPLANLPASVRAALGAPSVFVRDSTGAIREAQMVQGPDSTVEFYARNGGQYWLGYDTLPPKVVSSLNKDSVSLSDSVGISYQMKDNVSDAQAYLCLIRAGETSPRCSLLVHSDSVSGTVQIPRSLIPLGAQVWIEGRDSRNVARSAQKDVVVQFDTIQASFAREEDKYDLLSMPYTARGNVYDAFKREFGAPDPTKWRVFRSDSTGFKEVLATDTANSSWSGYWVRTRKLPLVPWLAGGWTLPASVPVQISLKPGWNMVGNPFDFDVGWSQVKTLSGLDTLQVYGPYSYDGADKTWSVPDTFQTWRAWTGIALLNSTGRTVTLDVPSIPPSASSARAMAASTQFRLGIVGWQKANDTARVWVGIDPAAAAGMNKYDNPVPPIPDRILAMTLPARNGAAGSLFTDVQPPADTGVVWTVHVSGLLPKVPLNLQLSKIGSDTALPIWVLDVKSGRWIEYQPQMNFAVGSETQRDFQVRASLTAPPNLDLSRFGLENRAGALSWYIPQSMGRTRVLINFYDLRGRIVFHFVDEAMDPGAYTRAIGARLPRTEMIAVLRAGGLQSSLGTLPIH